MNKLVLSITANPSIDKIAVVDSFGIGQIHRPQQLVIQAGGKGVNVARAIKTLGGQVSTCLILGGHSGKWMLEELARVGIPAESVWARGETRTCLSVLDLTTKSLTEIYEPSKPISKTTWKLFEKQIDQMLPSAAFMTLSGSLPVGSPPDAYARLIRLATKHDVLSFLDASGQGLKLAVDAHPYAVKINRREAADLLGEEITTIEDTASAANSLREFCQVAIITLGAEGAVLAEKETWHFQSPPIQAVCAVGSGDSFLGGICTSLQKGGSLIDAMQLGVAAGAANAQTIGAGSFEKKAAAELKDRVLSRQIKAH